MNIMCVTDKGAAAAMSACVQLVTSEIKTPTRWRISVSKNYSRKKFAPCRQGPVFRIQRRLHIVSGSSVLCPTRPTVFTRHRPSQGCFVIGRLLPFPYRHVYWCELARYKQTLLETEPTGAVQFKIHYETTYSPAVKNVALK